MPLFAPCSVIYVTLFYLINVGFASNYFDSENEIVNLKAMAFVKKSVISNVLARYSRVQKKFNFHMHT